VQQEIFLPESPSIADCLMMFTQPPCTMEADSGREFPCCTLKNSKHMKILHTAVRMSTAALAAAATLPR